MNERIDGRMVADARKRIEEKRRNHQANLAHLTGYYHGDFFQDGINRSAQPTPFEQAVSRAAETHEGKVIRLSARRRVVNFNGRTK